MFVRKEGCLNPLQWLVGKQLRSAMHREHDWLFEFDGQTGVVVSCLWRLRTEGRIRLTCLDDGQQFGLPSPVVAETELNSKLGRATVTAVDMDEGSLDIAIRFDGGRTLDIIPDSSGYESWIAYGPESQLVAVGGGDLAEVTGRRKT